MIMHPTENLPDQPKPITTPVAGSLAVAVGLLRLVPHPWNFTPSYAMEIFSGARLRSWHAFAIPLAIRAVTDLVLLLIQGVVAAPVYYLYDLPFTYLAVVVNVLLGKTLCSTQSPWRIGAVAILASEQFFLISNLGTWLGSGIYPHTLQGLITCYAMAIPFFGGTLLSSLAYSGVLFGAHALLTRKQFELPRATMVAEPS
jgi:hypothetical protein